MTEEIKSENKENPDSNEKQFDFGTRLAEYILAFSGLIQDQDKKTYLWTDVDKQSRLFEINSSECKAFLTKTGATVFKRIPSKSAIDNVINYFWALAIQEEETMLYERVRFDEKKPDNILINLNDYFYRYVLIEPNNFSVLQAYDKPLFKINPEAKELPYPLLDTKKSYLNELLDKFDFGPEEEAKKIKMLLYVWIHTTFIPNIAIPLLSIYGGEGSGKTRLASWLHEITDPNEGKTFSLHRADDLLYTCGHSRVIVLDNLREIRKGLSDELCRIILGDTKFKRQLYTNNDICKFKLKNILMTTSINNIIITSDLLDRSILIKTNRLEGKFVSEEELDEYFNENKEYLFGEIVNNLSKAIALKPKIQIKKGARMRSFSEWGEVIGRAIGYPDNYFINTYLEKIDSQKRTAVEENLLGSILIEFMTEKNEWQGTINELLSSLQQTANNEEERKALPKTAGQLSVAMDEIKVVLTCANIKYNPNLKRTGNRKYVELLNNDKQELIKNNSSDLIDNESDMLACFAT